MMKVVVTGATGFLGKKLAFRLKQMGFDVVGLGRNTSVGKELEAQGINFESIDIAKDKEKLIYIMEKAVYVFHCAALSSPWGKYADFYQANVIGTKNVIEACKAIRVTRLIHVSTPSLYFDFDERLNVKECDPLPKKKMNYYAETKYLAEKEVDDAFKDGLPVITIRPRALFGPEDTTIIPRLIRTNEKKFIPIINNGKALMDITYVENVVDALLLCMDSPSSTLGKKYNITNGEQIELYTLLEKLFKGLNQPFNQKKIPYKVAFLLAELLEIISKLFLKGKEPMLTKYTVSVLSKSQTLSIEKAKEDLGYEPRISVEEGIQQFITWWNGAKKDDQISHIK